jgi:lipopolysaccharide export system protein LptA
MPRLIRVITSFATVLGAYWLYALVAVPLIEPAAPGPHGGAGSGSRRGAAERISSRLAELQQLVPPEARSLLETPWIIESGNFKLLLQEYKNLGDGRVHIEPCMLICTPVSSQNSNKTKPPIVLYAPKGATMVFDRPLDLRQGDVGHPESGTLHGEITITSPGQSSGPEDNLRIVTRDVQLTPERISTMNSVQFSYGASFGSGRNLVIKLQHDEQRPGSTGKPPDIKGIESFELLELDHLHLEPPKKSGSSAVAEVETGPAGLDTQRPLEITCQGPFRFDPVRQYAKFQDQVDVMQLNPVGEADQLNCELLTLYFSRSRKQLVSLDGKQEPTDPLGMDGNDLELRQIEATGNPVIVRVLSRDAEARGERLSYDVQQKLVVLGGDDEVFLREKTNVFRASSIQYKLKGKGRLGEILSRGPGSMRGTMPNRPDQKVFVSWGDQLKLEPFEDQHLLTLSGGVKLDYSGVGALTAERIDFWLFELPAGPDREKLEVVPDRMTVQNQVKLDSPEAVGEFKKMEIWFERVADTSPTISAAGTGESATTGESSRNSLVGPFKPRATDDPIERQYTVRGNLAQARFLIRGQEDAELAELMLEGNVQLDEIPLVPSADRPMHLEGDRIQVLEAHDNAKTKISVIGRLAMFRGRGMALIGTNINVDAGTNRLWIDGSGEMRLPVDRDLKGNPLSLPGELAITWQKKMDFDGRRARALFEERVVAHGMGHLLQTESLEAVFNEQVDFSNVQSKTRPKLDLKKIACRGGVFMTGRTFEKVSPQSAAAGDRFLHRVSLPTGVGPRAPRQESWEEFRAVELTINRRTGDLLARGPGQITTIQRKSSTLFEARQGRGQPPARPAERPAAADNKLAYLHVQFQQMMTGNTERRVATFHEQVRCVYDKVDSWRDRLDVHDPDSLGEKTGVLLTAERLTVAEAPTLVAGAGSMELEAIGNVIAENSTFIARANRVTYSEAKDWLILEGNGYAPAELSFQEYVGAPWRSLPGSKIHFWPKTREASIADGRSMQMNGLPFP